MLIYYIAELCKGSTSDSDSLCSGSNPDSAATSEQSSLCSVFFIFDYHLVLPKKIM